MGNIASNLSDFAIFTDDNPREENELDILKDILKGVTEENYIVEPDRRKAIISGLNMIKPGDTLLILIQQHNMKEEGMLYPMIKKHCSHLGGECIKFLQHHL